MKAGADAPQPTDIQANRQSKNVPNRLEAFIFSLTCGFLTVAAPIFLPDSAETAYRAGLPILFVLLAAFSRRNKRLSKYFQVILAFSTLSLISFLDYSLYLNQASFYWLSSSRMDLYVYFKLISTALVDVPIIVLTKASANNPASIYLTRGNLRKGLAVGLASFTFFLLTAIPASTLLYGGRNLTFERMATWMPWILPFIFANGLKEELEFRGLFLRKYEVLLSPSLSNILQAIIFTLPHLGETYSPVLPVFLVAVFLLGLAFGAAAQKTNSLLGSILFHAGSDIPVILGILSNI